ncbi:MAG TPA: hypothetical protein VGW74_07055 [Propionibacteriaceae bacterium]|nr:hypothetical protein [Propionibacteriaceae bacterium]
MGRPVVPVRSLGMRLPDAGRIRIGVKVPTSNGKSSRPEKIDRFRFTSQDRAALDQVAEIYGGRVIEWKDPKAAPGQWQVITDARELRIALPPDPLGNTPIYELWSGGGCQRRCDGETVEMLTNGPDGLDLQQAPCICDRKGTLECSLHTRLSVLLPEVRFSGVWRLDTKSHNAAAELPGMVELIRSLQDRGIVRATMRVEWRKQVQAGQTREFAVPVLGIDQTLDQLAAGHARLAALSAATQAAGELGTGDTHEDGRSVDPDVTAPAHAPPAPDPDDEVVDAEVIEPTIGPDDVAALVGHLNAAGPEVRRGWRATFDCAPNELPASRLDEARAFVGAGVA